MVRLREIFPAEKMDINIFLKHQCDLSSKNELLQNYMYVPKLLSKTFMKLLDLKNKDITNDLEIAKSLNGFYDLSDEKYANISSIMVEINNNDWSFFNETEDYLIIGEILYIWLDECVKYCINPSSISDLFKSGKSFQNKPLSDCLLNSQDLSQFTLKEINLYISESLKKYEFEILKYCALFFKEICPKQERNKIESDDFDHMTEKMAIYLLGYNIDLLYENEFGSRESSKNSGVIEIIQNLIILLDFLRETSHHNLTDENQYNALKEEVRGHLTRQKLFELDEPLVNQNIGSRHSVCFGNIYDNSNSREQGLFEIYQMLKLHFDQKGDKQKSNMKPPIIHNNCIVNNAIKEDKGSEYKLEDNISDSKSPSQNKNNLSVKNKEDWFSKKKKSQGGIFILGKKRSTLKLKYRFSLRNKSNKNNNSSSVNNQSFQDNIEGGNQITSKSQEKLQNNMLVLGSNIYKSPQHNCISQEKKEEQNL